MASLTSDITWCHVVQQRRNIAYHVHLCASFPTTDDEGVVCKLLAMFARCVSRNDTANRLSLSLHIRDHYDNVQVHAAVDPTNVHKADRPTNDGITCHAMYVKRVASCHTTTVKGM